MAVNLTTLTFTEIAQKGDRLAAYLKSLGIILHPSSFLARAIEHSHRAKEFFRTKVIPKGYDVRGTMGDMATIWYVSDAILNAVGTYFESIMKERLPLLASGNPSPLTSGNQSYERDRIFELMCARICSLFVSDVRFGDDGSGGPDIVGTFRGKRWALECKSAYGSNKTTVKAIRNAVGQLESSQSDFGIVLVQLTNIFPHERTYAFDATTENIISAGDEEELSDIFSRELVSLSQAIDDERAEHSRKYPEAECRHVNGILYIAQTVSYFRRMRVTMGGSRLVEMPCRLGEIEREFCSLFNEHMQKGA